MLVYFSTSLLEAKTWVVAGVLVMLAAGKPLFTGRARRRATARRACRKGCRPATVCVPLRAAPGTACYSHAASLVRLPRCFPSSAVLACLRRNERLVVARTAPLK
jgi:hypothetical protein